MQTYTFDTVIQNGMISIPEEFKNYTAGEARITIQKNEPAESRKRKSYSAGKLNIAGFKFNREEANARR